MAAPAPPVRLRATGITKKFGRREVLSNVNFEVRAGEVAAVIGSNGAGKSTFLKICAGLISPTSGRVEVNGSIGYCPQAGGTFDFLRPSEHFVLFGRGDGLNRDTALTRGREMAAMLGWEPEPKVQARHLSGGTRQKLNVILSTLGGHDILLLDEPYQGFDRGTYTDFWEVIWRLRDTGRTIVVITHMLNTMDRVDQVLDLTPTGSERNR
ncbi:ATP-binding cassette domain-containing protein [Actinoplanes teichomyceticus]|uniref:ABC transporter family protein n=1 Tax=Actinoplanes teichomyceticus TaxID=1867 RepID=A0A561VSX2_ACTTI|nr:ABC transporter ATP-binding protein [Actinoplanes teichomyceticus]TWG14680.1 ABC transporter family protein [Actinoplanes teichomyceticus]GIF10083.1 ABC transporter ATP-binding protein [Actinoplanes teichomyceticus]